MTRLAGLNFSNYAHLAAIEQDDFSDALIAIEGASDRLSVGFREDSLAADLVDLKERIRMDLRDWRVEALTVVQTSRPSNWNYGQAFTRSMVVAAALYAADEEQIEVTQVKVPKIGAALLHPLLGNLTPEYFGLPGSTKYWSTGLREAYAAAAYPARN